MKSEQLLAMTDKELISLIGFQNTKAYNILYNRYWEDLYVYVFAKVKNHDIVQDILQEFWIKIWKDPSFILTNEAQVAKGFFCKFLHFRVLDYYRTIHYKIISLDDEKKKLAEQMGYSHILEEMSLKDMNAIIESVIDNLPKAMKNIAKLRREGNSVNETARLLSISEKTVRNKYSLAMARIKEKLKSSIAKKWLLVI